MKTTIPFYNKTTHIQSNCGDPLKISFSSAELDWEGVLLERGTSPYFHPKDVTTPNFYFAVEMENSFTWQAVQSGVDLHLETEPGDIWINPPNTPFTHNIDVPCDFTILNISPDRLFSAFQGQVPKGLIFLNNYNIQDQTLYHLIHLLLIETKNQGGNGKWYVDNVIQLFANYFIRHYSNYTDLIHEHSLSSIIGIEEMSMIDAYIQDHLSEALSIEALAEMLNVSKFYFLNEFKKFKGITPYQHILNQRIIAAKDRLKDRTQKITVIAYELGFSDSSHFSRTFKKATGMSPKMFRDRV